MTANLFQMFPTQFKGSGMQFCKWDLIFLFSLNLRGFFGNFGKLPEPSFRINVRVKKTFSSLSTIIRGKTFSNYNEMRLLQDSFVFILLLQSFSCIPYTDWKVSVSGVILVSIFPHFDWIRSDTDYLSIFSPNAGKYGQE